MSNCPLCQSSEIKRYFDFSKGKNQFSYHQCHICSLVFMDRSILLTSEEEVLRYQEHENDKRTTGYENFLRELINPVVELIGPYADARGLDYGSGPYPMLAEIMSEEGHKMDIYDPFFASDESVFSKNYDYITCCEVAEHFYEPLLEFKKLHGLLGAEGLLGLRTGILWPDINFARWHYKEDDTHVCFYTPKTFEWICQHIGFEKVYLHKNVIILKKVSF